MENRRYEINDIESMLAPKCEFKASERLKASVMARAKASAVASKPAPRSFVRRFAPWLAAACVAAVMLTVFPWPKGAVQPAEMPAWQDATAKADVEVKVQPAVEDEIPAKVPEVVTDAVPEAVSKPAVEIPASKADLGGTLAKNERANADKPVTEAVDMDNVNFVTEADMPITNMENYELTAEELAMIQKQEQLEYLAQINLELEMIELMIKSNNKILEHE